MGRRPPGYTDDAIYRLELHKDIIGTPIGCLVAHDCLGDIRIDRWTGHAAEVVQWVVGVHWKEFVSTLEGYGIDHIVYTDIPDWNPIVSFQYLTEEQQIFCKLRFGFS